MENPPEVHVVAHISLKPDQVARALEALDASVVATRQEEGCIAYELFRARDSDARFVMVERWRSQADLDAHMKTPHVARLMTLIPEVVAAPPEMYFLRAGG